MEESINVEVMFNENADGGEEGKKGGLSVSDSRMMSGMGVTPGTSGMRVASDQSERRRHDQPPVIVKRPRELDAGHVIHAGDAVQQPKMAPKTTTTTNRGYFRNGQFVSVGATSGTSGAATNGSGSDDSEVSDISSDVSSRLSPLTPSPDYNKGGNQMKGFITVASDLSASTHAIDKMAEDQLRLQAANLPPSTSSTTTRASATGHGRAATAAAETDHLLIRVDEDVEEEEGEVSDDDEERSTPTRKVSLFKRLKNIVAPEGPPGEAYVMSEDELGHMTVNNILYFTGAVILVVLIYVLYAQAYCNTEECQKVKRDEDLEFEKN